MSEETPLPRRSARLQGLAAEVLPTAADAPSTADDTNNPGNPTPFTPDDAGAYQFVCQVLLNKPPATQRRFYAVMEDNGLQDDILC